MVESIPWTPEEMAKDIAVVEVRRRAWASHHLVRLRGAESPHVHQRHDLAVTVLSGRVRLHLGDQAFIMRPGDVADIPHGVPHWAENLVKGGASEAYTIFTPSFDGQDTTPAEK